MDAEQLWETTMNPDAALCFKCGLMTLLPPMACLLLSWATMSSHAAEFAFEKNALEVKNLDV